MKRHRYRLIEKHKHWHGGRLYASKDASLHAQEAVSDELELTEEQAGKISHKLERVDVTIETKEEAYEEFPKDKEEVKVVEEVKEEVKVDTGASAGLDKPDEPGTGNPAETQQEPESPEKLPLKMVYVDDGKYNVIRGDNPINDVPLSQEEAKSLMESN